MSVNIIVSAEQRMLTVPLTAVTSQGVGSAAATPAQVYVIEDGVVRAREVRTGAPGARRMPIIEGIREGDRVVVDASAVKPGQRVEAVAASDRPKQ